MLYALFLVLGSAVANAMYLPSEFDNRPNINKPLEGKLTYYNNGSYIFTVTYPCSSGLDGCERSILGYWLGSYDGGFVRSNSSSNSRLTLSQSSEWILESGPPQELNQALPTGSFVGQCTFDFSRTSKRDPHRNVGICYGQGKCFRRENGSMFCQPTGVRMIPYFLNKNCKYRSRIPRCC